MQTRFPHRRPRPIPVFRLLAACLALLLGAGCAEKAQAPEEPLPTEQTISIPGHGVEFSLPLTWMAAPETLIQDVENAPAAMYWVAGLSDTPEGNGFPVILFYGRQNPPPSSAFARYAENPEALVRATAERFLPMQQYTPLLTYHDPVRRLIIHEYGLYDPVDERDIHGALALVETDTGYVEAEYLGRANQESQAKLDFARMLENFKRSYSL